MGLWEFLRQWRPSRVTVGVVASILLHLAVVAIVLWGGKILPDSRWKAKKGDALIVELPKPEEPAPAGTPKAPIAPPAPPARPSLPPSAPKPAPTPPTVQRAPAPPEERRVASAPRSPAPAPPAPAPRAAEPIPTAPKGTEPLPAPAAPVPKAAESTPQPAQSTSQPAQSTSQPAPSAPAAPARPPAEQQVASVPQGGPPPGPPAPDMRTALRRGAGGTGLQGRGGIEGEPIRLDSEDPRYNDYLEQIRRRIQEKWGYPCIKTDRSCEYKEATLDIEFGILKDGRVQFVDVVRGSEYQIYDEYAATAIKLASPFPPVPQAMLNTVKPGSPGVPIRARFAYYIVKSSLTNLLH
jgi:TonB family protein